MDGTLYYMNKVDSKWYEVFPKAVPNQHFDQKSLVAGDTFILGHSENKVTVVAHDEDAANKQSLEFRHFTWDFGTIEPRMVKVACMKGSTMAACVIVEVQDDNDDESDKEEDTKIGVTTSLDAAFALKEDLQE